MIVWFLKDPLYLLICVWARVILFPVQVNRGPSPCFHFSCWTTTWRPESWGYGTGWLPWRSPSAAPQLGAFYSPSTGTMCVFLLCDKATVKSTVTSFSVVSRFSTNVARLRALKVFLHLSQSLVGPLFLYQLLSSTISLWKKHNAAAFSVFSHYISSPIEAPGVRKGDIESVCEREKGKCVNIYMHTVYSICTLYVYIRHVDTLMWDQCHKY